MLSGDAPHTMVRSRIMNRRGQVSTVTIVLLVVGLVVGAAGGYFMISSSLQPKINDYESQVADLNSEVSDLSATISLQEEEIADRELQVYHLIEEIHVLEVLRDDMQSELDELEQIIKDHEATASASAHILTVYESQITDLEKEIVAYRNDLVWSVGEIERLEALLDALLVTGTDTFTAYGWQFKYPEGWTVSVSGNLESIPTENSGTVQAISPDGESAWSVGWLYTISATQIEMMIDGSMDAMIAEIPDIELGERVTVAIEEYGSEHFQKFQSGTWSVFGLMFSAWYCDVSDYYFIVMLFEPEPADMFATLYILMENFECH